MSEPVQPILVGESVRIYPRGKRQINCADFWYHGKHHRRSLKTRNQKVARQRAMQIEMQLQDGTYQVVLPPKPIGELVQDFIKHLQTENRRPKTITKYKGVLRTFQEFVEGHKAFRITQITLALIDKFRASRKPSLSIKSMHNEAVMIKSFLGWAKQRKYIPENPLAEAKFERPRIQPRGGPAQAQVEQILALTDPRRTQYAVIAFTGMRSGELQRLLIEDVDLQGNWIHIVSREGAETKTGFSRKVPIHPQLKPLLQALPKKGPWLFNSPASRKYPNGDHWINTKHLNEDFLKLLAAAGANAGRREGGFSLHSLRNSFETLCVNQGIPQRVVDTWLGHNSDKSMGSVYYKLSDEDSQKFMTQVSLRIDNPAADAGKNKNPRRFNDDDSKDDDHSGDDGRQHPCRKSSSS